MYILCERPGKRLLAADLLATYKAVDRHGDSTIDVLRSTVFREPHLAESFADSHNRLEMTDLSHGFLADILEDGIVTCILLSDKRQWLSSPSAYLQTVSRPYPGQFGRASACTSPAHTRCTS